MSKNQLNENIVSLVKSTLEFKDVVNGLLDFKFEAYTDEQLANDVEYQTFLKIDENIEQLLTHYIETWPQEFVEASIE